MNRLRKIASWLWLNKERMVLAVMVIILMFRVRAVVQPEIGVEKTPPALARRQLPEGVRPPAPPGPAPTVRDLPDYGGLSKRNMFVWVKPGDRGPGDGPEGPQPPRDLKVLSINPGRNETYRAWIQTASSKKWIAEGKSFEKYVLLSIDPDEGCCEILATDTQQKFRICVGVK